MTDYPFWKYYNLPLCVRHLFSTLDPDLGVTGAELDGKEVVIYDIVDSIPLK
jgi:hypothetical protein